MNQDPGADFVKPEMPQGSLQDISEDRINDENDEDNSDGAASLIVLGRISLSRIQVAASRINEESRRKSPKK